MHIDTMPLQQRLQHIKEAVEASLHLWQVPKDASVRLINVSENATYLVETGTYRSVLRIHRPGYHSRRAIEQELAWSSALSKDGIVLTPPPIKGIDDELVQTIYIEGLHEERFAVMFEFAEGSQPVEGEDLSEPFERLGAIAARTHEHSSRWLKPEPLDRLVWNEEAVFGANATWGDWRKAPNVTPEIRAVLEDAEVLVRERLRAFGKAEDRFGLIHADMRLANLLIDGKRTWLIDFDDCGLGWFLYDFAAGISFMEDHVQVPALRKAWIKGYRSVRPISDSEEAEIDTFIMLRRMALLAWIGSHIEAPEPQVLAPDFAQRTSDLARTYLTCFR